jgi:hypothetical protein
VVVGDSLVDGGTVDTCAGNLAQRTFRFTLCTCEALQISHPITTDSYVVAPDGGLVTGRKNGSIGTDEGLTTLASNAHLTVSGSVFVSDGGVNIQGATSVDGALHAGTAVTSASGLTVGADAYCASDVQGNVSIAGALHAPATSTVGTGVTFGSRVVAPVSVTDPCDCTALVDIAGIVRAHQGNNDDGQIGLVLDGGYADGGLSPATWATGTGPTSFTFPCGRYYLSSVNIGATTTWHIAGRTALLVDGDFVINHGFTLDLAPGSEVDLFIAGSLQVNAPTTLGNQLGSSSTRLYVGGGQDITLNSPSGFYGNLYAPYAQVTAASPTDIYGAVFSRRFLNTSPTHFHYDENVLAAGVECIAPPTDGGAATDGGAGTDGGTAGTDGGGTTIDPALCDSCNQCNNQACISGVCSACTDSSQCCSPLVCVSGFCQVLFAKQADGPVCKVPEPGCPTP